MISKKLKVILATGIKEGDSSVFLAFEDMIFDFARELKISISDVLECLSYELDVPVEKIIKFLKKNNSRLALNNNVVCIIEGKEMKRTTLLTQTGVILRRMAKRLGTNHGYDEIQHIREVFKEHITFAHAIE